MDTLSQSEIDALLSQMLSNDSNEIEVVPAAPVKEARNFDFANPLKFNREQLRTLENIFENFSRALSSFLTGYLRTTVNVEVSGSEEIMYRDFNVALANPVILALMEFNPLKGTAILELSSNIGYAILDRILGGPGFGIKKMREFSEVEKILLERVMLQIINFIPEPWEGVIPIRPKLEKLETNAQFAQVIGPTEKVALVLLNLKIGSSEGTMTVCLPHRVIEPITDRLYSRFAYASQKEEDKSLYKERLEVEVEQVAVPVSVNMGYTRVMVSEFLSLQVGDVIPMDSFVSSDVDVMVGNLHKFRAKPGTSRGKYAIQITEVIRKEDS